MSRMFLLRVTGQHDWFPMDKAHLDGYLNRWCGRAPGFHCRNGHRRYFTIHQLNEFIMDVCFCNGRWFEPDVLED